MVRLISSIPPTSNHCYGIGNNRVYLKAEGKAYKQELGYMAQIEAHKAGWEVTDKQCYVDLKFYFPNRRRKDASNGLKLLLDALTGVIYVDDNLALPRIQEIRYDKENPRVEITITKVGDSVAGFKNSTGPRT